MKRVASFSPIEVKSEIVKGFMRSPYEDDPGPLALGDPFLFKECEKAFADQLQAANLTNYFGKQLQLTAIRRQFATHDY